PERRQHHFAAQLGLGVRQGQSHVLCRLEGHRGASRRHVVRFIGRTMMARLENLLAALFGAIFLGLSALIAIEVVVRKVFGISLQGANELGGYALAVGSTLAFTLALFGRNHIRVDVLHERLSATWQAVLNWFSSLLMAGFAALLGVLAIGDIRDTLDFQSTAQTSWATP